MTFRRIAVPVAAALLVLTALPAAAQRTIAPGQTVSGRLTTNDPVLDDGSHFHIYRVSTRAGERYQITLRSDDFDAFLAFGRSAGSTCSDDCVMDDDGADGTDSRLRVTTHAAGTYEIRVNTLGSGETGAYRLSVEALGPAPRASVRDIAVGQTVSGALDPGDGELDDGTYHDLYRISARAGERLEVTLRSTDFDSYLAWGTMEDGVFQEIESDDDSGGELDSQLVVTAGRTGTYFIRATSLGAGETGAYTLAVRAAAPAPPPVAIRVGQTVSGRLETSDLRLPDRSLYDVYHITARAGERVRITLRSNDFDAFLHVGRAGGEWESLETDDDSGGGTDARIEFAFPSSGVYEIRANSLISGETGAYTLAVEAIR
jgi:hypothetical protein